MNSKPKQLLIVSLILIATVFIFSAAVTYRQFSRDFTKNEMLNQQKISRIVNQSMNRYFETLKFITENSVLNHAFNPEVSRNEDTVRYAKSSVNYVRNVIQKEKISKILTGPRIAKDSSEALTSDVENWKVFKGLPELDEGNLLLAKDRRLIAKNIIKSFKDIHYVFEMDVNGDLVFLEPYSIQKNVTSFNYEFRDYLRLVKASGSTAISEGYISHDQNRTQIITVASPILNSEKKVVKIFAVSVSATTLRERVFRSLKENMDIQDATVFYLVDRHGHVVASSSGKNIYFPTEGSHDDERDLGNLRYTGFFKNIPWTSDVLENGNIWERNTKSWVMSSLKSDFHGEYTNLNNIKVFATFFPTPIIGSEATNWGILVETPISQLWASENYLKNVFLISGLILIIIILTLSIMTLKGFSSLEKQVLDKRKEIKEISDQVAHDIRSPLAALDMVVNDLTGMSEEWRILVRSAVGRIKDIANQLIEKNKISTCIVGNSLVAQCKEKENTSIQLLSGLVEGILTEKRMQYRSNIGIEINGRMNTSSYGLFAEIQPTEFKRVLSNLVNNSVEAMGDKCTVTINLEATSDGNIKIKVQDNGKGIPKEILSKLGDRGETHGKEGGSGLGLYHARTSVESWGGKLELQSQVGCGTTIIITLPKPDAPPWFVAELWLTQDSNVVVLDDDESVHHIWQGRADSAKLDDRGIRLVHLSTPSELRTWIVEDSKRKSATKYLLDYELLGFKETGLDLVEEHGIASQSILVTSRYEERAIRERCLKLKVPLIPKGMAGFVPIRINEQVAENENVVKKAILIDDDLLIHSFWSTAAKSADVQLSSFKTYAEFTSICSEFSKDTPVYIDSNLGDGIHGETFIQELNVMGFKEVYLATGYPASHFASNPGLKVVGKEAPESWSNSKV